MGRRCVNFYKHYIGDFQRDTGHLSLTERGAYLALMHHYYATEQGLPTDHAALCRIAGAFSKPERDAVKCAMGFFELRESRLWHKRIEAELEKQEGRADTNRRIALEREARKRAKKEEQEEHERSTNRAPDVPRTEHEQSTPQNQSQNHTSLRSVGEKRASRLPADWNLPDEWREWAKAQRPDLDPDRTAEKFADYWRGVGGAKSRKLDWLATWRNWVREERAALSASAAHAQESFRERDARAAAERVAAFAPDIAARMPSKTNFSPEIEDVTAIDRY